ncbi:hypothetical protein F3Y22_tig00110402pilonHSYRG00153 [Hibiscus syriacus]|uniref:Reverse transcriptase Ty1/copia-type domain-containing protein n=1 Tax=Hibiscus syriacus TaxID=106335 RepID=A0A6A3ANX5_HIBSY|nr:hypothetical protein F3Y22_tig00110402pilonHSYRG00153 [Hibiscus syriacus]
MTLGPLPVYPMARKRLAVKWVFAIKYNSDYSIQRYKVKLVAKGFTQTYGIDNKEAFAPVAKLNTARVLLNFTDLGKLRYFKGMEVARSSKGLVINQRKYVLDLLSEAGMHVAAMTTKGVGHEASEKDSTVYEALRVRRQDILDNIRDNDEAGVNYQKEIEANEKHRCQLQGMIEEAISNNGSKTYLRILSQYRLRMANTELQFKMAMRDQIIHNQREAQRNLWNLIMGLGLDEKQILELAAK